MGTALDRGALLHKRYRIVEILGQGGMGSVYRAVDENLGMDVAVKENLFTSQEYARQFRLEAVILANLRHPNLPRVTDHFVIADQGQYLIMDYIEGEDLRQRMERKGIISEEEAILIGIAICDALQFLHTRNPSIIHRDVKPGNVRITPDGHIFLVDFGLAKLVKGRQATTTGARAMTPGYSPPEQYGTARTDARTDIYSLGATLYVALSGIIPEDALARAMDNIELTSLRKRDPKISRKLANVIEKAMAVHPEDRFQSADEFKQALVSSSVKAPQPEGEIIIEPPPHAGKTGENKYLAKEMPSAGDASPPMPPSSKRRKSKPRRPVFRVFWSVFALALLAALLAVIIFWSPISHGFLALQATHTSAPTMAAATVAEKIPPLAGQIKTATLTPVGNSIPTNTLVPAFLPSITPTPTQTLGPTSTPLGGGYGQIAFASYRTGLPQIFMMDTDGINLQQVTEMTGGACQPDWSPDGLHIVFISPCSDRQNDHPGAKLYVINVDGGGLTELPSLEGGAFDPVWSPDGKRIAFASLQDNLAQIYVMDLSDNLYKITALTRASRDILLPDWVRQPAWSPDGKQIVYTGHSRLTDALQIWVMSDLGYEQTLLINRGSTYWDFLPKWSPDGKTILFNETSGPQELGWLMVFDYENRQNSEAVHLRKGSFGNHGSYSPDGSWVLYENIDTTLETDNYHIVIMKIGNGNLPINLPGGGSGSMDFDPAWRPIVSP
jgi:serine/threonine protein kinase/Tol biopolymer transport system component